MNVFLMLCIFFLLFYVLPAHLSTYSSNFIKICFIFFLPFAIAIPIPFFDFLEQNR